MKYLLSIICFLCLFSTKGQMCHTPDLNKEQFQYVQKIIKSFSPTKDYDGEIPIVRLSLNQVNRSNGQDGLSWTAIDNLVSGLSGLYNNLICFSVVERNEIDDDDLFGAVAGTNEYEDLVLTNPVTNAIRIYFVEDGNSGGLATGPVLNPLIEDDPLTIDPTVYLSEGFVTAGQFVNTFTTDVLAHEIGHCLGLWHTHSAFNGQENVARTGADANCNDNGDLLCDTPADPNLQFLLNPNTGDVPSCTYIGNLEDPEGVEFDPLTNNVMSYTHPTCMTSFTNGQIDRCLDFIFQTNLYDDIVIPEIINIDGSLAEDQYYHADEDIESSAEHTDGIVDYRARQTITMSPGFHTTASATSEFTAQIDDDLCHDELINNSGLIGDGISTRKENENKENFIKLYPNPAHDFVSFEQHRTASANLTILDINGAIVKTETINGSSGQINISDLPKGIYIFQFASAHHIELKRIVIQ